MFFFEKKLSTKKKEGIIDLGDQWDGELGTENKWELGDKGETWLTGYARGEVIGWRKTLL